MLPIGSIVASVLGFVFRILSASPRSNCFGAVVSRVSAWALGSRQLSNVGCLTRPTEKLKTHDHPHCLSPEDVNSKP